MYSLLLRMFYHPVIFFFALPLFYMALGVVFSIPYASLHGLSLLMFYFFILINQMLENVLLRLPEQEQAFPNTFFLVLELLNLGAIFYFGWQYSWIASLVLIGFTLITQLQFLLDYYDLELFRAAIASTFKVFLLNGFAFYIGTHFMHVQLLPAFSGLFFPFFLHEASRMEKKGNPKVVGLFLGLSYFIGTVFLWQQAGWMSLSLWLTLPFAWAVFKDYNGQTASTFAIFFALAFILLIAWNIS